jgi:hypothetical protein
VRLSPLGTSATVGLLYQPRMIEDDDYGAVGGIRIGRGNRSTRRKPAPVPLCPPQVPHDLGSNPGRRSGKPATNRLSYGKANQWHNCRQCYCYCHVTEWRQTGFGLMIGFIGFIIQLVTTSHKSLLHTEQCSQSRCLVTASNSGRSSASGLMSLHASGLQTLNVKVKVTLRPTISRSVSLGFEPHVGLVTWY